MKQIFLFFSYKGTGSMSSVGPANFGENYNHPQTVSDEEDEALETDDDVLDSFKMVRRNGKKHFCKCKRGPVGLPGAPGIEGKLYCGLTSKQTCYRNRR